MTGCHVEKFLHMRNVKKIYHKEKVPHMLNVEQNLLCGEICHVEIGEMFPHDIFLHMSNEKCGANLFCGKISPHDTILSQFTLFCRDLRAFVWRKVEPKTVLVEKKRQISGMSFAVHW